MSSAITLRLRRSVPVILQAESAECGLACLAMIAGYHGFEIDLATLRHSFSTSHRGLNLAHLMQMASDMRMSPRALRLEPASVGRLELPCIVHWNMDHFVVLEKVSGTNVHVVDPAYGRKKLAIEVFSKHFTGIALELVPAEGFQTAQTRSSLKIGTFFKSVKGLPAFLGKLFALSLALQALALVMPFFGQLVIDQVLPAFDLSLLGVLAIAFGLFVLLNTAISALRSFLLLLAGVRLQLAWATRLFHHLLRVPLSFFEKRHMGDILSRFRSLSAVQNLVTNTIVEAVIDGIMAVTTLVVMLIYGPLLTLVPVVALAIYTLSRLFIYPRQQEAAHEALVLSAKENSHFLESLRGILAIKSFSREQARESAWQNRATDAVRAGLRSSVISTTQQLANQLLFALENIIVVALGARAVMDGGFSVGMLVAFLSYKSQFTARASGLVDKLMDFRLASVHLDRLSDIALAEVETGIDGDIRTFDMSGGELVLRDISYRYSALEPYILHRANLRISTGECVAIIGPSGCGKTTLLKIMMSLLNPDEGQIFVDGRNIHHGLIRAYRKQIAAVMQEDTLLSGALLENITFFDAQPDREQVEVCARVAAIHDEIQAMPMGYSTLVGDMGAALSGGQKQRILLARALYAKPKILFLDEATSHVDPTIENRIHLALAEMKITRVIVAHRRETWAIADRVINLKEIQRLTPNDKADATDLPLSVTGS